MHALIGELDGQPLPGSRPCEGGGTITHGHAPGSRGSRTRMAPGKTAVSAMCVLLSDTLRAAVRHCSPAVARAPLVWYVLVVWCGVAWGLARDSRRMHVTWWPYTRVTRRCIFSNVKWVIRFYARW